MAAPKIVERRESFMRKSALLVGFGLAAWWGLSAGASAGAKPAALPAHNQIECPDCGDEPAQGKFSIELDITSKGITLKVGAAATMPDPTPGIDTVLPTIMPAYLEVLLKLVGESLFTQVSARVAMPEGDGARQARRLFEVAEMYRRGGDFDSARHYYQRVHVLAPISAIGRLAIERLGEVEERLRDAEESGHEESDEMVFQRIRRATVPLGLVEVKH
jgi:hypothetical protein